MKIGIVGGGVVGDALAHAFSDGYEVRVYDRDGDRCRDPFLRVVECDVVFVCIPERFVPQFFSNMVGAGDYDPFAVNFVIKSTVPIGTTRRVHDTGFRNVCHSPEFLTARTAREDAANPRLNVIGAVNPGSEGPRRVYELYLTRWPHTPVYRTSSDQSELVKLAMNSFFAVKVAYFNEIRCLCDKLGLDYETIRDVMVAEGRVSDLHTHVPGPDGLRGFGGTCLPGWFTAIGVNGRIPLSRLSPGDRILSTNAECDRTEFKEVRSVKSREYAGELVVLETPQGTLECTPDHLIPVVRAGKLVLLRAGDVVITDEVFVEEACNQALPKLRKDGYAGLQAT